jgi:hypothetical protein
MFDIINEITSTPRYKKLFDLFQIKFESECWQTPSNYKNTDDWVFNVLGDLVEKMLCQKIKQIEPLDLHYASNRIYTFMESAGILLWKEFDNYINTDVVIFSPKEYNRIFSNYIVMYSKKLLEPCCLIVPRYKLATLYVDMSDDGRISHRIEIDVPDVIGTFTVKGINNK